MASKDEIVSTEPVEDTARAASTRRMKTAMDGVWRVLASSLGKIVLFLFVAMPIVFLSLMWMGGHVMAYLQDWPFQRGYNFMASAITGGAIVFPADPPNRTSSKFCASIIGASGVGLFGFNVAALSGSLVDPIIIIFGLNDKGRTVHGVYGKLGFLATIVIIANLLMAAAFGWFFSQLEPGVPFIPAFKAMASIELGGGVVFHDQGRPHTATGTLYYSIIGIWAIGVAATMIAIAAGPAAGVVEEKTGLALATTATAQMAVGKLVFLVFIAIPLVLLLIMLGVACVMSPLTTWEFEGAFWAALPATTGGAAALHSEANPPLRDTGVVVLVCVASAGFFILSLFIGVGSKLVEPIIREVRELRTPEGYTESGKIGKSLAALFIISFIVVPLAVFTFAIPVGGLLAHIEGWPYEDGFWWCVAVQLGGGMALTSYGVHDIPGMLVGTVAVAFSIGVSVVTVGLSGAPVVMPLMEALGLRLDVAEIQAMMCSSRVTSKSYGTMKNEDSANNSTESVDSDKP